MLGRRRPLSPNFRPATRTVRINVSEHVVPLGMEALRETSILYFTIF